jgi:dual specificity tyrosine-phosphorylation-regulated kinase 2/3/4
VLPRKATGTPSSSRTTPDPNRKSYSSGLSIGSINSFNTVRTSTGSIQPRMSLGNGSRLPAPKSLNLHNPSNVEDDEYVPPVPAIPKVYESPKDAQAEMSFLDKRKSTLAFDTSSIHSSSTGSITGLQSTDTSSKVQRKSSTRKSVQASKAASRGKNLQPLRLPPINLGPLSTPTTAKIAALQDQAQSSSDRNMSPPPARRTSKTPTTPMTASKSSFFSRHRQEEKTDVHNFRSSSSVHHNGRQDSPLVADATSSTESIVVSGSKTAPSRSGMTPYLSSSVPKGGADPAFLKRSKTGGDYTLPLDGPADMPVDLPLARKPSGPRGQRVVSKPKSPQPLPSPEEPPTPSSMSSLRRKLSLSWKRSNSKSSISQGQDAVDKAEHSYVRQDSMPPPRLPASAINKQNFRASGNSKPPSPTPSTKSNSTGTTYLESRRRKSSTSSLNAITASESQRNRSDSLAGKKDTPLGTVAERSTISHNSSVVQKILKPKASTSTMRQFDVWTADLDKDDLAAEDEMKKLGARRKETELAARTLDALRKRATPKERVSPQDAIRIAMLNIYERGEIVDYNDIYFCGTQNAAKVVGDLNSDVPNFGYDDERGDYSIVPGDHLSYRYEIIDILGKGSFGQVVRCIDHKTGVLVAIKIIRNKKRFHQQALVEVNILQKLREWVCTLLLPLLYPCPC